MTREDSLSLWATPILVRRYEKPALNAALLSALLERPEPQRLHPTHDRFHPAGWSYNIFKEFPDQPCFGELHEMVQESVSAFARNFLDPLRYNGRTVLIRGWWNGYQKGQNIVGHNHAGVQLTASYYPDVGVRTSGDPQEGNIVFFDPRGAPNLVTTTYGPKFEIKPEPGMLIVFPGFLFHETVPYHGDAMRVAISCDIVLQGDTSKYSAPKVLSWA